jgi:IS5 family transposase
MQMQIPIFPKETKLINATWVSMRRKTMYVTFTTVLPFSVTMSVTGTVTVTFANEGKMVDASFMEVPRQRNNREENRQIKEGAVPSAWQENGNKLAQKDTQARWTRKNNVSFYGYKNHVKADTRTKLIKKYAITDASVHDSQVIGQLLDPTDKGPKISIPKRKW